jgi:hypothetical protein
MTIKKNIFILAVLVLSISLMTGTSSTAEEDPRIPKTIPGDLEGKWYGIHYPGPIKKEDIYFNERNGGEAFPNQTIIDSWGYKAKPIEEIKDLIPEFYYTICSNPDVWAPIRINETALIPFDQWPTGFVKAKAEASEKYKGQAYLDEKGHLRNYKAGWPFPKDSTNPVELAWNYSSPELVGQELVSQFYSAVVDKNGSMRAAAAEQNYLWWRGRLVGDPKYIPEITPNPNNYWWFQTMAFKYPYDLQGVVSLTQRYDDPDKDDDQWMYLPVLRRVRRMSTAQRWDKLPGGQDITWEDSTGFAGKVTNYEWKILGRKIMLCSRQAKPDIQEVAGKPGGTPDQLYQRVNVIILEYIPKPKMLSSVSRVVMYLDPDTIYCYYSEAYDRRGRPYLFHNHCWAVSKEATLYPGGFLVADLQRTHSSSNYLFNDRANQSAIEYGIEPSYFGMERLKKKFGAR